MQRGDSSVVKTCTVLLRFTSGALSLVTTCQNIISGANEKQKQSGTLPVLTSKQNTKSSDTVLLCHIQYAKCQYV